MTKMCALILFNERVEQLNRSSLAKRMENSHYTLDYERVMKGDWISADGVTEDAVNAFVLNIRPLVQDKDNFSIRCLAKDVYTQSFVPAKLRDRFNEQRGIWCEHKKLSSLLKYSEEDRNITNGKLFDVLIYGGLAHANPGKVNQFYTLTKQGAYSFFVCVQFLSSLWVFLGVVRAIRDINVELLNNWDAYKPNAGGSKN